MKRQQFKQKCSCGCERRGFISRMVNVEIERPAGPGRTRTQSFLVLRECQKPWEEELAAQFALEQIIQRWYPRPKTPLQRLNVVRTFWRYCRRVGAAWQILRAQHALHERRKMILMGDKAGFEWCRRNAIKSAVLFGCPRFMQDWLGRQFLQRAKRKQERDAITAAAGQTEAA